VEAYLLSRVWKTYVPYALAEPVLLIKREDWFLELLIRYLSQAALSHKKDNQFYNTEIFQLLVKKKKKLN